MKKFSSSYFEWNNPKIEYSDKTIHGLFEQQVEKSTHAIALETDNDKLTYLELNEKSNQISGYLRRQGIKANDIEQYELNELT